ncbi:M23 family metallopeptidase [Actinoplanes sp. DH11]|uniref:M23 family metallopeptidase n=1 Tax=Actinoplanes sp. DH11 TaxID=2857011 RepID=UPI001E2D299D|nr:M23 family metallopeptidase [Actinoplanes sp. DH11]
MRKNWLWVVAALAGVAVTVAIVVPRLQPPGPRPLFQLPVRCGETWRLNTYPGHDDFDVDLYPARGRTWGRPVLASYPGTVVEAGVDGSLGERTPENPKGEQGRGGGYWVKIDHGGRWQTLYLHLLEPPPVDDGDEVTQGQEIGKVGSTGDSSAPHLHYEQLRAGEKVESWFDGRASGITSDDREYGVDRKSNNACAK